MFVVVVVKSCVLFLVVVKHILKEEGHLRHFSMVSKRQKFDENEIRCIYGFLNYKDYFEKRREIIDTEFFIISLSQNKTIEYIEGLNCKMFYERNYCCSIVSSTLG